MSVPPIPSGLPIVDKMGRPTPAFIQALAKFNISANDSMPAPPVTSIQADYTGAFLSGELPASIILSRTSAGKDVTGQCQWAMIVSSGMISATIAAGVINVTALSSSSAVIQVKSTRNGVALYANATVNKVLGAAPASGSSGGSTSSATTFTAINSAVHSAITGNLSVTVGASGNVSLSAPLSVGTAKVSPDGDFPVYGKWQWYNGAAWVDVAAEVASSPDAIVTAEVQDTVPPRTIYVLSRGTLTVNTTQTGLTPGATAKFQLMARNGSGTRTMTFSGTASAVPQ